MVKLIELLKAIFGTKGGYRVCSDFRADPGFRSSYRAPTSGTPRTAAEWDAIGWK
jgi:hypothetical protein